MEEIGLDELFVGRASLQNCHQNSAWRPNLYSKAPRTQGIRTAKPARKDERGEADQLQANSLDKLANTMSRKK